MEIKKETGVVMLKTTGFPIGVVILQIVSGGPRRYLVRTKSGKEVQLSRKELFPVCQGISQETDFDTSVITGKLPEIIKNFAVMYHDLRQEVESLKKQTRWLAQHKKPIGTF